MAFLRRKFIIILISVLVFLLALDFALSPSLHKEWINKTILESSGFQTTFGRINYSLFSPGTLRISDATVTQPAQGLSITLDEMQISVAILPLLRTQLNVESVFLKGLNLDYQSPEPQPENPSPPPQVAEKPLPIERLFVEQLTIEQSNISLALEPQSIQANDFQLSIKDLLVIKDATLLTKNIEAQLSLSTALQYADYPLETLNLAALAGNGKINLTQFDLPFMQGEISINANVDLQNDLSTTINIAAKDLNVEVNEQLLTDLGIALPAKSPDDETLEPQTLQSSEKLPVKSLYIERLEIENSRINYALSDTPLEVESINFKLSKTPLIFGYKLITAESINESNSDFALNLERANYPPHLIEQVKLEGKVAEQHFQLTQAELNASGVEAAFIADIDLSLLSLPTKVESTKVKISVDENHRDLIVGEIWPDGNIDANTRLSFNLAEMNQSLSSVNGTLVIQSQQLTLHGLDLNSVFQSLEESEETSLLDVGSFLVTGPLGLIANQVANLGKGGLSTAGGQTNFGSIHVDVSVTNGILQTQGLAFTTDEFRGSLHGQFDLSEQAFKDMKFSLLDENHCATVQQTLNGKLNAPEGLAGSLASTTMLKPFTNIFTQAGKLISECEPVYQGKVAHP